MLRLFLLCVFISGSAWGMGSAPQNDMPERCQNRQWQYPSERLDCKFPPPPIGRWHAVYTKAFAKEHNLPLENISQDLSPGVDYMEMDVQPYGKGATGCFVNMLVQRPNDIAMYDFDEKINIQELIDWYVKRKMLHHLDIEDYRRNLKSMASSIQAGSRDSIEQKGFRTGSHAFYVTNIFGKYDYITAPFRCRQISMHPAYFPDQYGFFVAKASVWGKYKSPFRSLNNPKTPRGQKFFDSAFIINLPKELPTKIFKDVPIGGKE